MKRRAGCPSSAPLKENDPTPSQNIRSRTLVEREMTSTNMADLPAARKMAVYGLCIACEDDVARATEPLDQPRQHDSARDAERMNCSAVEWALAQDVSSASSSRLLIEIARRSIGGRNASTQIDLGRACKLSERQTRTLIASLIADGAVKRHRQGGAGKGRTADQYELVGYVEATVPEQPAISAASQPATGTDREIAATGNGQSSPLETEQPEADDRKKLPEAATGNSAPTPPIRTTTTVEDSSEPAELDLNGGLGGATPPKPKRGTARRPKREKFYATEASMPSTPNAEMALYATSKKLINGTCEEQYGKFCRYHIRKRTLIASLEQRWETWVDNWAKENISAAGTPKGLVKRTRPDGTVYYDRKRTYYTAER